jgi:hypothetical protein
VKAPDLPANKVSRNHKVGSQCKPVGMAIVKFETGGVSISCGWVKIHNRVKVLEEAAQNHLNKKHGGQGLWL